MFEGLPKQLIYFWAPRAPSGLIEGVLRHAAANASRNEMWLQLQRSQSAGPVTNDPTLPGLPPPPFCPFRSRAQNKSLSLSLSLCIYIYIYMYTYIHVCVYIYIYIYIYVCGRKRSGTSRRRQRGVS